MARIPTYDTARVAPSAGGIAAPSVNPTQIAGQQIEKVGAALGDVGQRAVQVGNEVQEQVDKTRVQQAVNQGTNAMTALRYGSTDASGVRTPGYTEVQGEGVMHVTGPDGQPAPLTKAYPQMLQGQFDKIQSGLTPSQQRMFSAASGSMLAQFNNEVGAHTAQQFQVWKATVSNDTLTSAANTVASALPQYGTPQFDVMSNTASMNARGAINQMMADKGVISLDKDGKPVFADDNARTVYDTESQALIGKYVGTVVQAGVQNRQAPQALAYLESQKPFMSSTDYAQAHAQVIHAAVGTTAIAQADSVLAKVWSNHSAAPDLEKADALVRAANPGNAEQVEATRAELHARISNWTFNRDQTSDQAKQKIDGMIANGQSVAAIQATPEYAAMKGADQLAAVNSAQSFQDGLQTHGTGRGYDAVYGLGQYGRTAAPLSSMNMGDVSDFQKNVLIPNTRGKVGAGPDKGTGAVGAYQLTYSTLAAYAPKVLGANWRSQPFSPENQDKLGAAIWEDAKHGDLHKVWSSLPNNTPGAYANTSWDQIKGTIAQHESGGIDVARGSGQQQAEQWIANPGTLGAATPQNTQRILNTVGSYWAPKVIAAQKAYQTQATRSAMPTASEVNGALGQLGISTTARDAATAVLRTNVRAALNTALMAATQTGQKQLTPPERAQVIQQAAAVQVQQHHWYNFTGDPSVPLLAVKPEDYGSMTIPAEERERAAQGMGRMYAQTRDPRYAPKEENLRRYFLNAHGLQVPNGH